MGSGVSNLLQKPKATVVEPMNPLQSLLSRVPLHIALQATVVLQSHWRGYLARCKLNELKMHRKNQEAAAVDYLQTVRGRSSTKVVSKHFNSDSNDSNSVVSASHASNRYISIKGAPVNHPPHHYHNPGMDEMAIQETSEKSGSFGDFGQEVSSEEIIYPFVGFVIKSRLIKSNKKLFINVCHTPYTKVITSTPPRAWIDNTHHDENGLLISTEVAIIDILIASIDYEDKFSYKEGQGMVPNDENIKTHFADEIIAYLNTLTHCPDPAYPPLKGLTSNDDYVIDEDYKLPKIRRNYVGIISSLLFDRGTNELTYNAPFRLSSEELEASLPEEPKSKIAPPVYNSLPVPVSVSITMALSLASSKGNALIKSTNQEEAKKAEEAKKIEEAKKAAEAKKSPLRKTPTSPTKGGRSTNPANVDLDDDDDNDLLHLESHQLQYIQDMKKTREGIPVYVEIEQGFLFIFQNQTTVVKGVPQAYPYGDHELACILCSTVEYFIEADTKNNLFYLHVDLHPEEYDSPFTLSHYFNRYSRKLNKSKLAFQYDTYAEAVTWKYFLELHYDYAKVNYKRCQTYYQNIQFQHYAFSTVNESKTCWMIEKVSPEPIVSSATPSAAPTPRASSNPETIDPSLKSKKPSGKVGLSINTGPTKRKKYFIKIDRGFLGIFLNDTRMTPSWQNAEEIINLATITYDISHRKIIRLRKFMTKITIFDNRNKKREFFIRGDGENDPEIRSIVTCLDTNISYAKSLTFRYFFPWLEESRVLYNLANLSTMGCKVDLMIEISLPETSDDDSDIEEKEPDETIQEIFFKLIRPKQSTPAVTAGPSTFTSILNSPGFGTNLTSPTTNTEHNPRSTFSSRLHTNSTARGSSSKITNNKDKEAAKEANKESLTLLSPEKTAPNTVSAIDRFNQKHLMWNDILCDRFPKFIPTYFRASILFIEEMNLLFFYHETTLISCINIFKCLEKTKVISSLVQRKLKQKNEKKTASKVSKSDPKLYELESSSESEDDNSDRDYEDDILIKKDDDSNIKSRIVHLFGYDG